MELVEYIRFLGALILVLGMIGACAWAARRFGLTQNIARVKGENRLGVVETLGLDARHKLVLIRRDGKEHLVILGETNTLIESGIDAPPSNVTVFPEDIQDQSAQAAPASMQAAAAQKMSAPDLLLKGIAYLKERRS